MSTSVTLFAFLRTIVRRRDSKMALNVCQTNRDKEDVPASLLHSAALATHT